MSTPSWCSDSLYSQVVHGPVTRTTGHWSRVRHNQSRGRKAIPARLLLGLYGSSLAVRPGSLAESIKQLSVMVPAIALGLWAVWKDFGWREVLLLFLVVGLLALIVEKAIRMAGALWRDHHSTYR